jgi:DNA (cytosine-5)-methyltransferase 1
MDYATNTRNQLPAVCKERGLKGYSSKKKVRYIDLFCGLGAFHTAFNTSDLFECVLACDIDDGVRTVYAANYGLEPEKDIRGINTATMPDFDILCAGFPCQPFSIAGNKEGFNDKVKGNLFYDILNIIDAKNPPMCILENVKNLKTHDNGKTYKTIEAELKNRGYLITSEVLNATDYGSPQARQRIFIVATKGKEFVIPPPTNAYVPVSSIIDTEFTQNDVNLDKYILEKKPKRSGVVHKPHVIYDVISKATGKGGRQGERVYSIDSVGVTVCASSGGPGAKTGLYKVGDTVRRLNVKETLGMFGFPESYTFASVSREDALFYLGNSIVVNVVRCFVPAVEKWFAEA